MGVPGTTPGPWEVEPEAGRGAWIKGASGEWTALACGDSDDSARANARLIAAAPDLYEALSNLFENPLYQVAIGGNPIMVDALMERARNALALARSTPPTGEGQ